jgi:hypothetical protein
MPLFLYHNLMAIIETYCNQSSNGVHYGCVQIENSKGERLKFEVCAKDRHDAEIMLLSTILEIKDDLMDAYAMFETTSTIKRASIHEHQKRKKFKIRKDADKITRLYALRKDSGVEFKYVGDIDGFIPNIEEGKYVDINGYGRFRVKCINTTFDIEMGFIIQSLLLKEE